VDTLSNKIKAIFLTAIVLLSSSFIVIDSHYCCGIKMGTTLFGKAKDCGMLTKACILDPNKLSYSEDSCCENSIQFKDASEFRITTAQANLEIATAYLPVYNYKLTINNYFNKNSLIYNKYSPPDFERDIIIFHQNFRI